MVLRDEAIGARRAGHTDADGGGARDVRETGKGVRKKRKEEQGKGGNKE